MFLNALSSGLAASVTTQTPRILKDWLGGLAYSMTGLHTLLTADRPQLAIRSAEWSWRGELLSIVIGNGRFAGGGFSPTPDAQLDDGWLDVQVIGDVPSDEAPQLVAEWLGLEEPTDDFVEMLRVTSLEIEGDQAFQFNLDGEPQWARTLRVEIEPQVLPVIVLPGAAVTARG